MKSSSYGGEGFGLMGEQNTLEMLVDTSPHLDKDVGDVESSFEAADLMIIPGCVSLIPLSFLIVQIFKLCSLERALEKRARIEEFERVHNNLIICCFLPIHEYLHIMASFCLLNHMSGAPIGPLCI